MAAVIVAGGFAVAATGVAAASTVRKLQSAAGSKGVEHILSKEERDRLAAKHEEKIREHAGPGGMKAGLSSSLYAAKVGSRDTCRRITQLANLRRTWWRTKCL